MQLLQAPHWFKELILASIDHYTEGLRTVSKSLQNQLNGTLSRKRPTVKVREPIFFTSWIKHSRGLVRMLAYLLY